ncbi:MAG TPA: hypothetical protein VKA68_04005 [bacterium]|nr:hypothetical protein [bacterium]
MTKNIRSGNDGYKENTRYCSRCDSRFSSKLKRCPHCGSRLSRWSDNSPDRRDQVKARHLEYVKVLSTFNNGDVAIMKSILDGGDILYYFMGEHFNAVDPLIQPMRLYVAKEQVSTVKELLQTFTDRYPGLR